MGFVNPNAGDSIAFIDSIGNIKGNIAAKFLEEQIEHRRAVCSIDIIISKDKDSFLAVDCIDDAGSADLHAAQEKWIVQEFQIGSEVCLCLVVCIDATPDKNSGYGRGDINLFGKPCHRFRIWSFGNFPPVFSNGGIQRDSRKVVCVFQ